MLRLNKHKKNWIPPALQLSKEVSPYFRNLQRGLFNLLDFGESILTKWADLQFVRWFGCLYC